MAGNPFVTNTGRLPGTGALPLTINLSQQERAAAERAAAALTFQRQNDAILPTYASALPAPPLVKQVAPNLPRFQGEDDTPLDPLPADPTEFNSDWDPSVPTAIVVGTLAATGIAGPRAVFQAYKWAFRNILVGATVVEAASWYVAFQTNLFKAGTLTHDIQNYLLGLPHNQPLFTEDYTFLQRKLNDLPGLKQQRELAQRFLELPIPELVEERDRLLAQKNEIGAQESALLAARLLDLRLEQQRLQNLDLRARQEALALQSASHFASAALHLLAAGGGDGPPVPAGSADP